MQWLDSQWLDSLVLKIYCNTEFVIVISGFLLVHSVPLVGVFTFLYRFSLYMYACTCIHIAADFMKLGITQHCKAQPNFVSWA